MFLTEGEIANGLQESDKTEIKINKLGQQSINSDGQHFHQYQQKPTMAYHLKSLSTKRITTHDVENPGPSLGQAPKVTGLNRLMAYQHDKNLHRFASIQKDHIYIMSLAAITKMNDNIIYMYLYNGGGGYRLNDEN